jgi:hypothetical protein
MIVPSAAQVAPRSLVPSCVTSTAGPPVMGTLFNV